MRGRPPLAISPEVRSAYMAQLRLELMEGHKPAIEQDTDNTVVVDCANCGALLFGVDPSEEPYVFSSHQRRCTGES
jgi:hypothetical protein